jgi:Glyoxalase superfamily protein
LENALPNFLKTIPILRSFDETKAREFYVDYLAFKIDWEHRFDPNAPLYMQVSRGDLLLHLSRNHPALMFHVKHCSPCALLTKDVSRSTASYSLTPS